MIDLCIVKPQPSKGVPLSTTSLINKYKFNFGSEFETHICINQDRLYISPIFLHHLYRLSCLVCLVFFFVLCGLRLEGYKPQPVEEGRGDLGMKDTIKLKRLQIQGDHFAQGGMNNSLLTYFNLTHYCHIWCSF